MRTADEVRRFYDDVLTGHGLTLQQFNVLRILRGAGTAGLPTLEVAERMIERRPGVTRLIDRLEKKGFVRRQRGVEDRRKVLCHITPSALELLATLDEVVHRADEAVVRVLSEDERLALIGMIDRLRHDIVSGTIAVPPAAE